MTSKHQPDVNYPLSLKDEAVSFDPDAFDLLIREQGVCFVHWRAMACPLGMINPDDDRHPHEEHPECSNGFLYTLAGKMTCGFIGNTKDTKLTDLGRQDGSTAQIVIPRFYDKTDERLPDVAVEIMPYDRLFLDEESITVPTFERFASSVTGKDRLEFPVVSVTDLVDAKSHRYVEGQDFEIVQGQIAWGTNRPGIDPQTHKGIVCTARYRYKPHWYVERMVHEVRVGPVADPYTGERAMMRFPQQAIIQREYFFKKDQPGKLGPGGQGSSNPRTVQAPAPATSPTVTPDGGFGPRLT